jgi:tetratricopeptide (TPR) repeat protein
MPTEHYLVLLNEALKSHLVSLTTRERRRIREKFEFLESGFWDAGVRVKKLKGRTGRVIFEARMDRGDRLLFTLGAHRGHTAIYVWGIARHDGVSAAADRIVPRNAPFLDFAPMEKEDRPGISFDGLPRSWLSQEDVEQTVPEDYGPQKWLVFDEEEWRRLLSASEEAGPFEAFLFLTRDQEALLKAMPPVLLSGTAGSGKTTLAVYYLLRGASTGSRAIFLTYNPLLRGLAESIYNGLAARRAGVVPAAAPRFMVFRDLLMEITKGVSSRFPPEGEVGLAEFVQILNDHPDRRAYDPELVWEEIRSIIKGSKMPLRPPRLARLSARFASRQMNRWEREELNDSLLGIENLGISRGVEAFIQQRTSLGSYREFLRRVARADPEGAPECDAVLVEVLRLVSASGDDFSAPLLSAEEYLALGRKRAPSFTYDRRAIHRIAEYYQDRLSRSGRWDEIDLSKAALQILEEAGGASSWDLVICDEVQDLTDVQISLLFHLAADPRSIVLTGDSRQIINPSGFRWEEVKNKLYERGLPVPAVHRLALNFRCVGSIVSLSNALLDLKASLVGLSDTEMREEWKFNGRPPLLLAGIEEVGLLPHLQSSAASQAILTRSTRERDSLKAALGTELVFTVAEAKGLEFETVVLWKFCADEQANRLWKGIAAGLAVEQPRVPHLRHELALLYVAVTRARSSLVIYDGPAPSVIWEIEPLAARVFLTSDMSRLAGLIRAASAPAEWEAQGDYFLLREHYAAACECFRNAGASGKESLASAMLLMKQGDFGGAAPLFEAAGDREQAAACWMRARSWRQALPLWTALGHRRGMLECSARVHEEEGRFTAAAGEWEELGEEDRALEDWEKAGAFDRVGRVLAARGEHARAAKLLEKAGLFGEAADCLLKIGRDGQAGDLYFRGGDFRNAARCYRKAGDDEKELRCLRHIGDMRAVALFHQKRGETRKAIEAFAAHAGESEGHRAALLAMVPEVKTSRSALSAAIIYAALGMADRAGPLFLRAGEHALAARELEKAGDFRGLSDSYAAQGRFLEAARVLEKTDLPPAEMIEAVTPLLGEHLEHAEGNEETLIESLRAEAHRLLSDGHFAPAAARFGLLQDAEGALQAYRALGLHEQAIRLFLALESPRAAIRYARLPEAAFSAPFVAALVEELFASGPDLSDEGSLFVDLVFLLLARCPEDSFADTRSFFMERTLNAMFGHFVPLGRLTAASAEVLVRFRAVNAIMLSLRLRDDSTAPQLRLLREQLSRSAAETGSRDLAACAAFISDPEGFERIVDSLVLSPENVMVLGASRGRYGEAVAFLEASSRFDEADMICRLQGDERGAARIQRLREKS